MAMSTNQSNQCKDQEEQSRGRRTRLGALGKAVFSGVNIVGDASKVVGTGVVQGTKVSHIHISFIHL